MLSGMNAAIDFISVVVWVAFIVYGWRLKKRSATPFGALYPLAMLVLGGAVIGMILVLLGRW